MKMVSMWPGGVLSWGWSSQVECCHGDGLARWSVVMGEGLAAAVRLDAMSCLAAVGV